MKRVLGGWVAVKGGERCDDFRVDFDGVFEANDDDENKDPTVS